MSAGVPLDLFRPVVMNLLADAGVEAEREGWMWLGRRCNVSPDSIYRVFKGDRKGGIDFDLADLILTRCHAAHLWHEPPLNEIYWTLALECKNCETYLAYHVQRTTTEFCNRKCEAAYELRAA